MGCYCGNLHPKDGGTIQINVDPPIYKPDESPCSFSPTRCVNLNLCNTEQTDPPYRTGALSTEGLGEHRYRASLFIDTLNNDPIEEMNKTHALVVTAEGDVLVR